MKYEIKSDSLSSMTGYDMDMEDVEIELARHTIEPDIEPYIMVLDKVGEESNKRNTVIFLLLLLILLIFHSIFCPVCSNY